MSNHYLVMSHSVLHDNNDQNIEELLENLAETDPDLYEQFVNLDWVELREFSARNALERVARENNLELCDEYDNRHTGYRYVGKNTPPRGKCIGVLRNKHDRNQQVGLAMEGETVMMFQNDYSTHFASKIKEAIKQAMIIETYNTMLTVLGGNEPVEASEDGVTVLTVALDGGDQ